jgi:hypothetical protein
MSSPATLAAPLSRSRVQIRDRAHASEIARAIAFGPLFKNGGTVTGFADWLFVHRKTFNGPNPLQQARVYANRHRDAKKYGADFDAVCRARADEKEQLEERARVIFEANLAVIKACWIDQQGGPGIVLAITELCLGRGHRFADSPDGESLPNPPSWVLEGLLKVLEEFGGPDDLLDEYEWRCVSSEDYFRRQAPQWDATMMTIRDEVLCNEPPSEVDFVCVTCAAKLLSCMSWVRTTMRVLLDQVEMVERIRATASASANTGPAPVRPSRAV